MQPTRRDPVHVSSRRRKGQYLRVVVRLPCAGCSRGFCTTRVDGPAIGKLPDVDRLDFRGTTDGEGRNADTVRAGWIDPPVSAKVSSTKSSTIDSSTNRRRRNRSPGAHSAMPPYTPGVESGARDEAVRSNVMRPVAMSTETTVASWPSGTCGNVARPGMRPLPEQGRPSSREPEEAWVRRPHSAGRLQPPANACGETSPAPSPELCTDRHPERVRELSVAS